MAHLWRAVIDKRIALGFQTIKSLGNKIIEQWPTIGFENVEGANLKERDYKVRKIKFTVLSFRFIYLL